VAIFLLIDSPAAYSTYYWIMVITVIVTAGYNLFWIRKDLKSDRNLPADTSINWKEMLLFFIATVFISITDYLDATMLGLLSREAEVGYYTNAAKLVRLSLLVTLALNAVVFPQFSRIQATNNPSRSHELLQKSIEWIIFLTIPVSLLYLLFGKELVLTFSGSGFANSIPAVQWMAPIPLFISLSNLLLYYGLSSRPELQKRIALGVVVGILISMGMNSWLIPRYGALGAALNSLLTELIFLIYFLVLIKPTLPYASIGKAVLTALIFIPIYWMMAATEWSNWSQLLIGSGSCLFLYAGVQHFFWKHAFMQELHDMFASSKKGNTRV
jgi:O-antigen/teichoic acid export membrane protein